MEESKLPKTYRRFRDALPAVFKAYEELGAAAHRSGPLDGRAREIVKLAIAVGNQQEGGVRAHARRAAEAGVSQEELLQVVALAVTSIGFARSVAAFSWITEATASDGAER